MKRICTAAMIGILMIGSEECYAAFSPVVTAFWYSNFRGVEMVEELVSELAPENL